MKEHLKQEVENLSLSQFDNSRYEFRFSEGFSFMPMGEEHRHDSLILEAIRSEIKATKNRFNESLDIFYEKLRKAYLNDELVSERREEI